MASRTKKPAVAEAVIAANGEAAALFAGYGQLADLGRENFAAMLQANQTLTQGFEAIGREVIFFARASFERAAETATALLGARTFEDVVQLQTEFAQGALERMIERSTKLSEMGVKLANEALTPLGGRVEATIQTLSKPLAA